MKNFSVFLSENFQFLEVKFSIYLNRRVFVMCKQTKIVNLTLLEFLCISTVTHGAPWSPCA